MNAVDIIATATEINHHIEQARAHLILADVLRGELPGDPPEHTLWRELNAYQRDVARAAIRD